LPDAQAERSQNDHNRDGDGRARKPSFHFVPSSLTTHRIFALSGRDLKA
jgi:hypothetical protein